MSEAVGVRSYLHRAVPLRWSHPLSVNARVAAWAAVEAVLSAPVLALLLCMVVPAALSAALTGLLNVVASWVEWAHRRAGDQARRRKNRTHNAEFARRVREWVAALTSAANKPDLRRGHDIGNGVSVRWPEGAHVVLMPGYHSAPLFDDAAFLAAAADAEASRVGYLENIGHTPHCARRMVWGDGECECGVGK